MTNRLKALIMSEWYMMKGLYVIIASFCVISAVVELVTAASTGSAAISFAADLPGFGVVMFSMVFATDEWKGIGAYKRSMPYTDREMVLSRYLPPVCLSAAALVLTTLSTIAGGLIHGSLNKIFAEQLMFTLTTKAMFMLLSVIIFYPLFFRFGYKKTQIVYGVSCGIMMLMMMSVSMLGTGEVVLDTFGENKQLLAEGLVTMPVPAGIITLAVIAVLCFVSYKLSVKFFASNDAY